MMVSVDPTLRIEIFVADLDQTVAFYDRLGFEIRGRTDGPPRYAAFRLGQVRVGAAQVDAVEPKLRAVPIGTEIVIEVDNVREVRDRLVDAGVHLSADLQRRPWGLEDFRLSDPDGYYYRFTSRR
jgi:catechol 2,3-dioxygenase-like lactoylglutathione lyase family enzyme